MAVYLNEYPYQIELCVGVTVNENRALINRRLSGNTLGFLPLVK